MKHTLIYNSQEQKKEDKISRKEAREVFTVLRKSLSKFGSVRLTGSYRRGKEVLSDMDVMGSDRRMCGALLELGERVKGQADGKRVQVIVNGIKVDFWLIPMGSWGAGLLTTTGSKEENIWLRSIAKKKGMLLNQYGVWRNGSNLAEGSTEKDIYELLGVEYREPLERRGWLK